MTTTVQLFSRIFASYSHRDTPIIDACVAVYEALGIYIYIDKHSLRSGQHWQVMLNQFINKSDLFQLYWSKSSSQSKAVEDEWRYALSLVERKGETFIRPLYWEEDWPKPPTDLAHIHFAKLDLDAFPPKSGRSGFATKLPHVTTTSVQPSAVAVIPVMPGISFDVQKAIREDTAYAVDFLEGTTGLRYYPVSTLLVDEHVVKSVRALHTTDWKPTADKLDQALAYSDILRAIELTFHVRGWGQAPSELIHIDTLFGRGKLVTEEQYDCLRRFCEAMLQATVKEYVWPAWIQARTEMSGKVNGVKQNQSFSAFVLAMLDHTINTVKREDRGDRYISWFIKESNEYELIKELMARTGIQLPATRDGYNFISLEKTPFDVIVSALRFYRQELSLVLLNYDDVDPGIPADLVSESEKYRALAKITGILVSAVTGYNSPSRDMHVWLTEVIDPTWRSMRDELSRLNFHNLNQNTDYLWFLSACLDAILRMSQEGLENLGDVWVECKYSIPKRSWEVLQAESIGLKLKTSTDKYSAREEEKLLFEGPFSEVVTLYAEVKDRLISILQQRAKFKTQIEQLFSVQVPTYGIFVPANSSRTDNVLKRWAFDRGVPVELTFPQNARVLFCLNALEEFEKGTAAISTDRQTTLRMARDFQRSVLIHEHFHAILETGLDEQRSPAHGVKFDEAWLQAKPLNESLAVWMELHNARQNHDLMELVWSYIRAGSYPDWPYRGAEKIEALYQQHDVDVVVDLIRSLRKDPESAQARFDSLN